VETKNYGYMMLTTCVPAIVEINMSSGAGSVGGYNPIETSHMVRKQMGVNNNHNNYMVLTKTGNMTNSSGSITDKSGLWF
jgi:hydroxymethylglutaryl-CoA reductase